MIPESTKKRYTAAILIMMFILSVCNATQGILLTDFINHYGLESSAQGLISTSQSMGMLVAVILIALYMSRFNKSLVLVISAVLIPIIFYLLGHIPRYQTLLLYYGIFGICFGLLDALASSLMVDLYLDAASKYMNVLHGIFGLGGLAGPVFLQFLSGRALAWHDILYVLAGISLAGAIYYVISALPFIRTRSNAGGMKPRAIGKDELKRYVTQKRKFLLLILAGLYGGHQVIITVWITRYVTEYLKAPRWGALSLSLFWIGVFFSRITISRMNVNPIKTVSIGHFLSSAAILAGILSGNGFVMMICCALAGFAEGAALPLTLVVACDWEPENTSLGSSMLFVAHYIGYMIMPPVVGFIIAASGAVTGMLMAVVLSVAAGFVAAWIYKCYIKSESTNGGENA